MTRLPRRSTHAARPAAAGLHFETLEDRRLLSAASEVWISPPESRAPADEAPQAMGTFVPPPAEITLANPVQTVRAIVLNFEPTVPSEDNRTLWQIFNWNDPRQLATGFIADMEAASGGAVDYQIVQWRDLNEFPIFTDGSRYTADQYVQNRRTDTGWSSATADFYAIAEQQGLAELVNDNVIDEIWMFGDHYFSLLGEAWMAGPQSFFINGPSFPEFPVDRAVAGYGFSYERGVAEMVHNHGHRTENHISRAYGGWNIANPATPWDYFTANVSQTNGAAYGVGSVHYPFNAAGDYDYANTRTLDSYAADFIANFPHQTYATAPTSRDSWGDYGVGDWQRGYLKWFFGHMPRGSGTAADGRANNWYKYINDFNSYRPTTGAPRDNEAILGAPPLEAAGAGYEFTLRYYDVQGIDASTLDAGDVQVTGPGGYSQLATVVNVGDAVATTAGAARTVRYRVTGPGGGWDPADSGAYSVALRAGQVRDAGGAFLPAAALGSFQVNIADGAKLDVAAMLAAGQATVTATPWDIGGPDAIFDQSTSSLYRTPNIDPAVVTLSFATPQRLTGFRALFSHASGNPAYRWKVEAANSLADLIGQTGSYALLVPLTGTPADAYSVKLLGAATTASHMRLTVERLTGDDYVHINAWDLLTDAAADAAPPTAALLSGPSIVASGQTTQFDVRYSDDRSVDVQTVNFGDVRVTGPNGFMQTAALYSVTGSGDQRDVQYFITAPGGSWDYGDNGVYTIELAAGQVRDAAGHAAPAAVLGAFTVAVPAPESRPRIDLAELNAGDWYAFAAAATASTSDDASRTTLGDTSVRFDTTGGFDTYLRYQPASSARWDLTLATQFHFDLYAENPSPYGFQVEPIVRMTDADGDSIEYRYFRSGSPYPLWNDARNAWRSHAIDIKSTAQPATGWRSTTTGSLDWTRISSVEIHADTWDFGFTLWLDRAGFNLPTVAGDYSNDLAVDGADFLAWQRALASHDPMADGDGSRTVDAGDLAVWRNQFGASTAAAAIDDAAAPAGAREQALAALYAGGDFTGLYSDSSARASAKERYWRRAIEPQ